MFKTQQENFSEHEPEIVEEHMGNGLIKRYQKGRLLGKVTSLTLREDLLSALNSFQRKLAKDTQPKSLKKRPLQRAKPRKNCNPKYSSTNL
jgi:hypothetical protein